MWIWSLEILLSHIPYRWTDESTELNGWLTWSPWFQLLTYAWAQTQVTCRVSLSWKIENKAIMWSPWRHAALKEELNIEAAFSNPLRLRQKQKSEVSFWKSCICRCSGRRCLEPPLHRRKSLFTNGCHCSKPPAFHFPFFSASIESATVFSSSFDMLEMLEILGFVSLVHLLHLIDHFFSYNPTGFREVMNTFNPKYQKMFYNEINWLTWNMVLYNHNLQYKSNHCLKWTLLPPIYPTQSSS